LTNADQDPPVRFGRAKAATEAASPIVPKSAAQALRPEKVPAPPRRRSRRAHSQLVIFANFVMSMIVLVVAALVMVTYFAVSEFNAPGELAQNTNFLVRQGAGVRDIAENLERQQIISDSRIFLVAARTYLADDTLKAGEYEIKAGASMREVMDLLRSGKSLLYSVTFPEGFTVAQIYRRLANDPVLVGELPAERPPEGSLLPETYKFTRGTSRSDILDQMQAAKSRMVDQIWERRRPDIPIETKEEMVILASIVEKETARADERPRVAAVFHNRLRRGMRLQSDPTIIYGIFGSEGKPSDRPIYQSDIDQPTPYNTYTIDGLPPGPIANPGRAAMEAVVNPAQTDELYFVADGTGGHAFAKTLDEHNANVRRWRAIEARLEAEAAKAAEEEAAGESEGEP